MGVKEGLRLTRRGGADGAEAVLLAISLGLLVDVKELVFQPHIGKKLLIAFTWWRYQAITRYRERHQASSTTLYGRSPPILLDRNRALGLKWNEVRSFHLIS